MKQAFIIGDPITHSLSPKLHKYWLKKYNICGDYQAINISLKQLPTFFERLKNGEFVGGNITIPLKEHIFKYCYEISEEACEIGAINTIWIRENKIYADNSDWLGFLHNLDEGAKNWDKKAQKKQAIILGAGGAARAIVYALMRRKFSYIHILNRTKSRAIELSKQIKLYSYPEVNIIAHSLDEFDNLAPLASLMVNTSSIGMKGTKFDNINLAKLPKEAIVNDIVYTPLNTPLLLDAKRLGLKAINGLGMLLYQAVPGFERWFGKRAKVDKQLYSYMIEQLGEK